MPTADRTRPSPARYDVSRPDALAAGPQEIVLDDSGKPIPTAVKVAAVDANRAAVAATPRGASAAVDTPARPVATPASAATTSVAATAPAVAPASGSSPLGFVGGVADSSKTLMSNLFNKVGVGGTPSPEIPVYEPAAPVPSDVPLPPKRSASADTPVRMANAAKSDDAKPAAATQ